MKNSIILMPLLTLMACGGSYPVPTQRMADAQSAHRSAEELGAADLPVAKLHLKLAQDQINQANTMLKSEQNRRADFLLIRAKADAELALALAHAEVSRLEAAEATSDLEAQTQTNASQGGQQ